MAIDIRHGLSRQAAALRLAQEGYNQLPSAAPRSPFRIALDVLKEPMFLLLIVCGTLYLMLGDSNEALMLLGFVLVIIVISFLQNRRTERALEALRDLSSPRALVIRDGEQMRIPGREVVRGDLLVLSEGDRIAADAVLLTGTNLAVDESLLTGESLPVQKTAAVAVPAQPIRPAEHAPYALFSGTLVVQGKGIAQVLAVGQSTALGAIGKTLAEVADEPTHVQRETRSIVTRAAWAGITLAVVVGVVYGATRNDWLHGFLVGITLAMALLPEELPVVLTLFLGLGAWRIAQQRVLTRRIPAVEMLGAATVLCVDKTGTLTQNRMAVSRLHAHGARLDFSRREPLPENFHALLEFAMLASHRDPFDPMEQAINQATRDALQGTEHIHQDWTLVDEYPLSPGMLAMSRAWRSPDRAHYVIAAKGSPEAIFDLCHLDAQQCAALSAEATALAEQGLRVLGVARAVFSEASLPPLQHDFAFEFLGLLGLADPIRPAVPAAIEEAHAAGMRVVMITGDHAATALSIAREAGLRAGSGLISGDELDTLSDAELRARIREVSVFCRIMPEQKLRLVKAFKANGEIVAMTGDGVNDAPALKAAHIGIAMGARGTDVAREAADLVLLDDDFSAIVAAVRMGRRIFDNLRKAITFLVGVHVPIVGLSVLPVALGWPLLLLPVHILFLQLIIDPACSIVFEAEPDEANLMRRPPHPPAASVFDRHVVLLGLLQGMALLMTLLAVYLGARYLGRDADTTRALTFSTMVLANIGLIFASRSHTRSILATLGTRNRALWWVMAATLALMGLVLAVPGLRALFYFGPMRPADLIAAALAGGACIAAFETARRYARRWKTGL